MQKYRLEETCRGKGVLPVQAGVCFELQPGVQTNLELLVCLAIQKNNYNTESLVSASKTRFLPRLGQMAGYLGSAYFIGNLVSSLLWGWVSDIWGRRPVVLINIIGTLLSILLFGFSQNFAWAVSARILWGLADGIAGVTKSSLAEVSVGLVLEVQLYCNCRRGMAMTTDEPTSQFQTDQKWIKKFL